MIAPPRLRALVGAGALALLLLPATACGGDFGPDAPARAGDLPPRAGVGDGALAGALVAGIRPHPENPEIVEIDSFVAGFLVDAISKGTSGLVIQPRPDGDGGAHGYRIAGIIEGSPFARLGLEDGDVVAAINGIGLTSAKRAQDVLRTARRHLVVAVERGGHSIFIDINIQDGLLWGETLADYGDGLEVVPLDDLPELDPPSVGELRGGAELADPAALVAPVDDAELAGLAAGGSGGGGGGGGRSRAGAATVPAPGKAAGGGKAVGSASSSGAVSCSAADTCTLRRREVDRIVANPSLAALQVRYAPQIQGGRHRGYRLTSVTPSSAVAELGFRVGDVITKINGHSLTDDAELMALGLGLSGTSTYRIHYERGGTSRVKTVRIN